MKLINAQGNQTDTDRQMLTNHPNSKFSNKKNSVFYSLTLVRKKNFNTETSYILKANMDFNEMFKKRASHTPLTFHTKKKTWLITKQSTVRNPQQEPYYMVTRMKDFTKFLCS